MGNAYSGAEHEEPMGEGLCPGPVWAEEGSGRSPHLSDINHQRKLMRGQLPLMVDLVTLTPIHPLNGGGGAGPGVCLPAGWGSCALPQGPGFPALRMGPGSEAQLQKAPAAC